MSAMTHLGFEDMLECPQVWIILIYLILGRALMKWKSESWIKFTYPTKNNDGGKKLKQVHLPSCNYFLASRVALGQNQKEILIYFVENLPIQTWSTIPQKHELSFLVGAGIPKYKIFSQNISYLLVTIFHEPFLWNNGQMAYFRINIQFLNLHKFVYIKPGFNARKLWILVVYFFC